MKEHLLMKELGSCSANSSQVAKKLHFLPKEAPAIHISISSRFL